jgi:hypothetical protein
MLSVNRAHHCLFVNVQKFASVIAVADPMRKGCPARPPSPKKSPGPKYPYRRFLANLGYLSESNLALLDVTDCICRVSLREDGQFLGMATTLRPSPMVARNFFGSKSRLFLGARGRCHHRNLQLWGGTPLSIVSE